MGVSYLDGFSKTIAAVIVILTIVGMCCMFSTGMPTYDFGLLLFNITEVVSVVILFWFRLQYWH